MKGLESRYPLNVAIALTQDPSLTLRFSFRTNIIQICQEDSQAINSLSGSTTTRSADNATDEFVVRRRSRSRRICAGIRKVQSDAGLSRLRQSLWQRSVR